MSYLIRKVFVKRCFTVVVYKQAFDAKSRGRSVTPSPVQAESPRKDVSRISQKRCKPYFSEK